VKKKWKVLLVIAVVCIVGGGIFASIRINQRGVVTVQTSTVVREDLTSIVTASGEIKPKNYINLGANAMGIVTAIFVKEGDHVKKNQIVARVEAIQARADVDAQEAALNSALADSAAAEAGAKALDEAIKTSQADIETARANLQRTKVFYQRDQELYKEKLVPRQDLDQKKSDYLSAEAALQSAQARYDQMKAQAAQGKAQLMGAQRRVAQARAVLAGAEDVLAKHNSVAPLDGIVTDLPVRVGETVVPGVQNSAASTIMTIADMSQITAEVMVDETDIVSVQLGQPADVSIDAIPNRIFKGHVTEIGDTAILRSTGVAASQSATSSQEAKDFKVVIALENPSDEIRPGLSCTAKITTATRHNVLGIPLQALTVRERRDLEPQPKGVEAATRLDSAQEKALKQELQGVFVVSGEKAVFHKVDTGITGATDIEVLNGLKEGDQIITGSYQVIRTIKNDARVKVDNKAPVVSNS
jgi:HlyD family secretion protein